MSAPAATIVLTGGASRRMGRHKPAIEVAGSSFVSRVLAAAPEGPIVVVGRAGGIPEHVVVLSEDPPGSGPVAGIAAGLAHLIADAAVPPDTVLVLASDLPLLTAAYVSGLVSAAQVPDIDVAVAEADGHRNWLCAAWRAEALAAALAERDPNGRSVRSLFEHRRVIGVPDPAGVTADVDTPDDLQDLRDRHRLDG